MNYNIEKISILTLLLTCSVYANQNNNKYDNLFKLSSNQTVNKNRADLKNDSSGFFNFNNSLDIIEKNLKLTHNKLNESSKFIDEYITNEEDDTIYTDSFIRIENSIEKIESKDVEYEPNIDIRLKLPKLKDKLLLTIDNNDEDRVNEEFQDSNEQITNKDDNYNIGLLYNTAKKNYNLKLKISLKTTTNPYLYTQGVISKNFKIDEKNSIFLQEKLRYSHKHKFDNYISFKYSHKIDENFSFHNFNEHHINSEEKNDNTHNSLRLHQKLSNKRYLNYVTAIESDDVDSSFKIKEYTAYISYREYIRKWLYFDIVPSLNWYREYDFDRDIGLKLNLGVLISK